MSPVEQRSLIISMGKGRFYKEHGKLVLDLGGYTKALEYATDLNSLVIGKPSKEYFELAIKDLGHQTNEIVMIGDDIVGDVGGAQNIGYWMITKRSA